jgi:hypothetical protein
VKDDIGSLVESFLSEHEIPFGRVGDGSWAAVLAGSAKTRIPVTLMATETWLRVESFFMRAPLENHAQVYEILLRRNAREPEVRFCLDDAGDVYLVAQKPLTSMTSAILDRLMGAVWLVSEEMFDAAVQRGFATYMEHDIAWRRRAAESQRTDRDSVPGIDTHGAQ